jgi:hypothetical protein
MTDDPTRRPGTVHRVKARRLWHCHECRGEIAPGETYIYLNSFEARSGQWSRYLLCQQCFQIRQAYFATEEALGTEESYAQGELRSTVIDRLGEIRFRDRYQRELAKLTGVSPPGIH